MAYFGFHEERESSNKVEGRGKSFRCHAPVIIMSCLTS